MTTESYPILDLALEVREQIYLHILHPSSVALPDRSIPHSTILPDSSCLLFRLTCRQIHNELTSVLNSIGTTYVLDILVPDVPHGWGGLVHQWLARPAPPRHLRDVKVYFSHPDAKGCHGYLGCGGPGGINRNLLRLLGDFLMHGPGITHERRSLDKSLAVKLDSLSVYYVATDDLEQQQGYNRWLRERDEDKEELHTKTHDEWLRDQKSAVRAMREYGLDRIASSGLLFGSVKWLELHCERFSVHEDWEIKETDTAIAKSSEWSKYGWTPGMSMCECCRRFERLTYNPTLPPDQPVVEETVDALINTGTKPSRRRGFHLLKRWVSRRLHV